MPKSESRIGLRTKLLAFAPLRFCLTNFLLIAFLVALLMGNHYVWLVLVATSLGWAVVDELCSDDSGLPLDKPHWFYDAKL